MTDIIVIVIITLLVGAAIGYIRKEKKAGNHCIGCPHSKSCAASKGGSCYCQTKE